MAEGTREWVGVAAFGDERLCLRLTSRPDGSALLDLPGLLRFRLSLLAEGEDQLRFRVPAGQGPSSLELTEAGGTLSGTVVSDGRTAAVEFEPLLPLDRAAFAPSIGSYRFDDGREVLLGMRGDGAETIAFLADGDRVVHVSPIRAGRFISDDGERIELQPPLLILDSTTARRFEPYGEEQVEFAGEGVRLAGTLLSPRGDGPFPAVVLMHGSNPGERDFYRLYADRFARAGIAALVYDRRGSGASTGNPDSTLELRARDAAAAVRWLRQQPNIDPGAVGLWAFSNGTWSAVQVAAGIEPVAFMVVTGAAGVSGAESEIHRKVTELRGWGVEPALLDDVASAWRTAYACLASGQWPAGVSDAAYEALVSRLHAAASIQAVPLSVYAARNPWLAPIPPEVSAAELRRFAGHVSDLAYDPAEDYARIRCPVLFLVGEHDPNTPSAAAARIREVLERAGNTRSVVDVVPGAGHYINITPDSIEGMAAAEAASQLHGLRFVPGYLDRVPAWVRAVTRQRGAHDRDV